MYESLRVNGLIKETEMTIELTAAIDEARRDGRLGRADQLLERLAELVGARAGVQAVFGEPVRDGDLTVIPVARVRWVFGGGVLGSHVRVEHDTPGGRSTFVDLGEPGPGHEIA
jgi:hypothetical protein